MQPIREGQGNSMAPADDFTLGGMYRLLEDTNRRVRNLESGGCAVGRVHAEQVAENRRRIGENEKLIFRVVIITVVISVALMKGVDMLPMLFGAE